MFAIIDECPMGKLWAVRNPLARKSYKLIMATITGKGESTTLENGIKNCSRIQIIQSLVMTLIQQNLSRSMDFIGNNGNRKIIVLIPDFVRTHEKEKRTFSAHNTLRIFPVFFHLGD